MMHKPHRLQIQAMLSVMTQLKPKKTRMLTMMTRNLQALEMAPFCMILQSLQQEESDHVSIRVEQWIIRVHLLTFSDLIRQNELSKIFFQTTVTCLNGSIAQGGEFLSCEWMADTSLQGAVLRDMSWFMGF